MPNLKFVYIIFTVLAIFAFTAPQQAGAAIIPSLNLSYYQNNGSAQITVNADPNAAVQLYYSGAYNGASFLSTLGYTNYAGFHWKNDFIY